MNMKYFINGEHRMKVWLSDDRFYLVVVDGINPRSEKMAYVCSEGIRNFSQSPDNTANLIVHMKDDETVVLEGWLTPKTPPLSEGEIITEQLKYTPSTDTLRTAQQTAYAYMATMDDNRFAHLTAGLKLAYDLLDKMVHDDGLNELAGALEVITMLGSVNNSRWYGLLADKDNPIAGMLSNMVYGGRHDK